MIDPSIFRGISCEVNKELPAEPDVVKRFPRIRGAEYHGFIIKDTGLVVAYLETVGPIQKLYCSDEFFEKLTEAKS